MVTTLFLIVSFLLSAALGCASADKQSPHQQKVGFSIGGIIGALLAGYMLI